MAVVPCERVAQIPTRYSCWRPKGGAEAVGPRDFGGKRIVIFAGVRELIVPRMRSLGESIDDSGDTRLRHKSATQQGKECAHAVGCGGAYIAI
jgi:hypothetical protein